MGELVLFLTIVERRILVIGSFPDLYHGPATSSCADFHFMSVHSIWWIGYDDFDKF